MPKQREILIDAVPAPGEPLKPRIHEDNKKLMEAELAERAAAARSKLPKRKLVALNKRYRQLAAALNRAKYNYLVTEHWELRQQYEKLRYEIQNTKGKKRENLVEQLKVVKKRGIYIQARVDRLKPLASQFVEISQQLRSHRDYVAWEKKDAEDKRQLRREALVWQEQINAVFRQSPRLHHAGERRGKPFQRIPKIERIFIKEDRVLFQIKTSAQTIVERLTGRWHSALPFAVDIKDLVCDETLQNLKASCKRVVAIEWSNGGTNLFYSISRLDSPDGIPKKQIYSKVIDWYPAEDHAKTPWAAGVTQDRKVEWHNFEELPHILIAGSTKSGKSNHVNQMIATLITMNSPAEVRLMLVDLKGGIEFTHWQGIKHALRPMVKHAGQVLEALSYMRVIMERRLERFEAIKAKNLASYNEKVEQKIPRLICIVDEMATLLGLGDLTTQIHNELRVLSSQGRAVGIHLVLCTQHSSVDVLPGWVKTNMTLRISGKMPSHQASMVILDSVTAATLPNHPGRLVFSVGRYEIIAQSPFISDDEVANAVRLSKAFPDPDNSEFDLKNTSEKPKEKFTREDALKMCIEQFGGKLSAARIHEQIGNEVMTLRKLRFIVEDIIDDAKDGIQWNGKTYMLTKERKAYTLVEQSVEPKSEDDTQEFYPLHSAIEEN